MLQACRRGSRLRPDDAHGLWGHNRVHHTMHESDFQSAVTDAIIGQNADSLTVGVTENERAVIVEVNDQDAAYTANEARELAQALKCTSDQRWNESADAAVEYIRDLADVVDGYKVAEDVAKVWQEKELNP